MNFVTKEPINKGWSSDKKYCVTDENGTRCHGNNVAGALCRDDLCFEMKTVLRHKDTILIGDEYAGKIA